MALPTVAIRDLRSGTSQLGELNSWFRKFVQHNELAVLGLAEGRRTRLCGLLPAKVVTSDSADAGLVDMPTIVDADHSTINKPKNRDAEVYRLVLGFLKQPTVKKNLATRRFIENREVVSIGQELQQISPEDRMHTEIAISQFLKTLGDPRASDSEALSEALDKQLIALQQRSLFPVYDAATDARTLLRSVETEEFAPLSHSRKK